MSSGPVLLFDGDCGFCTRTARWLQRRGADCEVRPITPAGLTSYSLDSERATREVPFVHADGRVLWGAAAIAEVLKQCRGGWTLIGTVIGSAPGQVVARPVYGWVSRHRHRLPGGTNACQSGP